MNAVMFNIGMFSYMCMVLMPIFCRPDWPKHLLRKWLPERLQLVFPLAHEAADNLSCTLIGDHGVAEALTKKENTKMKENVKNKKNDKNKRIVRNWTWKNFLFNLICLHYVAVQLFLPYSHFLTKVKISGFILKFIIKVKKMNRKVIFTISFTQGYNSWTQGLYGYSWDMMIHSWSTQHVVVKVTDKHSDREQYLRPGVSHSFIFLLYKKIDWV